MQTYLSTQQRSRCKTSRETHKGDGHSHQLLPLDKSLDAILCVRAAVVSPPVRRSRGKSSLDQADRPPLETVHGWNKWAVFWRQERRVAYIVLNIPPSCAELYKKHQNKSSCMCLVGRHSLLDTGASADAVLYLEALAGLSAWIFSSPAARLLWSLGPEKSRCGQIPHTVKNAAQVALEI